MTESTQSIATDLDHLSLGQHSTTNNTLSTLDVPTTTTGVSGCPSAQSMHFYHVRLRNPRTNKHLAIEFCSSRSLSPSEALTEARKQVARQSQPSTHHLGKSLTTSSQPQVQTDKAHWENKGSSKRSSKQNSSGKHEQSILTEETSVSESAQTQKLEQERDAYLEDQISALTRRRCDEKTALTYLGLKYTCGIEPNSRLTNDLAKRIRHVSKAVTFETTTTESQSTSGTASLAEILEKHRDAFPTAFLSVADTIRPHPLDDQERSKFADRTAMALKYMDRTASSTQGKGQRDMRSFFRGALSDCTFR